MKIQITCRWELRRCERVPQSGGESARQGADIATTAANVTKTSAARALRRVPPLVRDDQLRTPRGADAHACTFDLPPVFQPERVPQSVHCAAPPLCT
jgi:hypothetical protein